jgi:3-dehydroquinate dehydratase-2
MPQILVLHGPNLNLLGDREPEHYGQLGLPAINERLVELGDAAGAQVECFQSNAEHALVERVHKARADGVDFIIVNPAAFTHTSIALRDALLAAAIPFIEVHLSNVHTREDFRRHSYFSDAAVGVITGFGADSYWLAMRAALNRVTGVE